MTAPANQFDYDRRPGTPGYFTTRNESYRRPGESEMVGESTRLKNALQLNSLKTQFNTLVVPYQAELSYLSAHQTQLTDLQNAVAKSPKQWQNWFWVCVGGMVLFIPTIWLTKGRWHPSRAKRDEDEHEAEVAAELKELVGADA